MTEAPAATMGAAERAQVLGDWALIRRWLERSGGVSRDPHTDGPGARVRFGWDREAIPGGFARATQGIAPDQLGPGLGELGLSDLSMAMGWELDAETALEYISRKHEAYRRALAERHAEVVEWESARKPRASTSAASAARDGRRRLADHLARLEARWGDRLDLAGMAWEYADYYESGARLEMGGQRGTVGCTSTARPEFVFLVSLPLTPRAEAEVAS